MSDGQFQQPSAPPDWSAPQGPPNAPGSYPTNAPAGQYPPNVPAGGYPPVYADQPSNGFAVAALVLGIIAIVLAFIPILNLVSYPLAFVGIGLGIAGIVRAENVSVGKGLAVAGTVLATLALVLATFVNVAFVSIMADVDDGVSQSETYDGWFDDGYDVDGYDSDGLESDGFDQIGYDGFGSTLDDLV